MRLTLLSCACFVNLSLGVGAAGAESNVVLGDYCSARGMSSVTADGTMAYCSRLAGTDASVWSVTAIIASNPQLQQSILESSVPESGDICYDHDSTAIDGQGATVYCNVADGGNHLIWQLWP